MGVDVDELDNPIGVGARGRDVEFRPDWSGNRKVFVEHARLVDQHVGPTAGGPLVIDHVVVRHPDGGPVEEGNGLGRVADVLVVAGVRAGRLPTQAASGAEIERPGLRLLGWPGGQTPPGIGARLEHPGLGLLAVPFSLQVKLEEGQLDALAVELGRLGAEGDRAERSRSPAAAIPRPWPQHVDRRQNRAPNPCWYEMSAGRCSRTLPASPCSTTHPYNR